MPTSCAWCSAASWTFSPRFSSAGESTRSSVASADALEVDLRGLRFIAPAGLHILLNAQRRLIRRGRRLTVRCRPGSVARALELARLSETLGVVMDN